MWRQQTSNPKETQFNRKLQEQATNSPAEEAAAINEFNILAWKIDQSINQLTNKSINYRNSFCLFSLPVSYKLSICCRSVMFCSRLQYFLSWHQHHSVENCLSGFMRPV